MAYTPLMKNWMPLAAIVGIILVILIWVGGTYNSFVSEKVAIQTAQSDVETQLQRRFDLIPNLVASVKGSQAQEQKVIGEITDARTKYAGTAPLSPERVQAANTLESAVSRLLVIVENYPDLKSNQTMQDLMTELEGTENRISVARQRYNETDQQFLQQLQTFPSNLVAKIFHFQPLPLFESTPAAATAPKVDFAQ